MIASDAPVLSLSDLENHDPRARAEGVERRFLCPLPACAGHQGGAAHRSLSANTQTGAWRCHRCGAAGLLRERWTHPTEGPAPATGRRGDPRRRAFRERLALPPSPPPPAAASDWRERLRGMEALGGSPGAAYLAGRGVPPEIAAAAGVRFAPRWYGRPAVVFPLRNAAGQLVAAQGRHTDKGDGPRMHDAGPKSAGLFATADALRRLADPSGGPVILTEAPIDALSLAAAGFPALALCGKELGAARLAWLRPLLAWRPVLLAFDADAAGDEAAEHLAPLLLPVGTRPLRLRPPEGAKDWNDALLRVGVEGLAAAVGLLCPDEAPEDAYAAPVPPVAAQEPADLDAGRVDLERIEAMVEAARAGVLPPCPVALGEERTAADPNAAALDLWEQMRHAKAEGHIAEARGCAGELLSLVDWWEFPGLADTSDQADPFEDDPDEVALRAGLSTIPSDQANTAPGSGASIGESGT